MENPESPDGPEIPIRKSRAPLVVLALVGALAALGVLWFVVGGQQPPPPPVVVAPQPPPVVLPTAPPAVDIADADALLKGATGLSSDPQLAAWLALPGIARRMVAAVVQVEEGESPRGTLGFLAPAGLFSVIERRRHPTVISPKSYARYDSITKVIGGVDAAEVGKLYVRFRPYAEAVFKEIAAPGKRFDQSFVNAVDRLAAVPLSDKPIEVKAMKQGVGYLYVDPKLEALSPAQKHLLRMGPANARVIVQKLQAFRAAISSADAGA